MPIIVVDMANAQCIQGCMNALSCAFFCGGRLNNCGCFSVRK